MVAPPDYRDYLADLIEERYGSCYRFCKESGVDPGHLSRVFASRSDLSLPSLTHILKALHATLVIQPKEDLVERVGPEDSISKESSEAAVHEVPALISELYRIVDRLEGLFPGRPFTVDGHLLGSIGEVLAAYRYNLDLKRPSTSGCDADSAGRQDRNQDDATQVRLLSL
jgi:hypothetical protein